MKTVPSPQTSWLVFIAEAGLPSWQPSAPRKSRVGFWITSEFRHARLRRRRPSSSNFPSPSNDHGQLKLRISVSFSAASRPPTALIFTRLRKSCGRPGQLSPRVNIKPYVTLDIRPPGLKFLSSIFDFPRDREGGGTEIRQLWPQLAICVPIKLDSGLVRGAH